MDSLPLMFAAGYKGDAVGVSGNAGLSTPLARVVSCALTGAGKQAYVATLTVGVSSTTTLNLLSGLTNPLGEAISSFGHVFAVLVEHDLASLATAGVTAFGGGSNDFQGPWSGGSKATLQVGECVVFLTDESKAGWATSGTVKNIALTNLDATALHTATVNVAVFGTTA